MTSELREKMREAMARDGYNTRRVSRWICQRVRDLFVADPHLMQVGLGDAVERHTVNTLLLVDDKTDALLDEAFDILRAQDPRYEGIQGAVIRAAIRYGASQSDVAA
jgi:hypothetical protein